MMDVFNQKGNDMKAMILAIGLMGLSAVASATDYQKGQCPVAPNCAFVTQPVGAVTYSDSETFILANWQEYYGVYKYTSSLDVIVTGQNALTPCSGRGCHGTLATVSIDAAYLDGVPMVHSTINCASGPCDQWEFKGSLPAGTHVVTLSGTASGAVWWGRWSGAVQGITYTLVRTPAPVSGD